MKLKTNIFALPLLLVGFMVAITSCEEVIELDLKTTGPKLVIEAHFTDSLQIQTVNVNKSVNFEADNKMTPVSGAVVILTSDIGVIASYLEVKPGHYATINPVKGVAGIKYTLTVVENNKTYIAVSQMPNPVKIESLGQTELTFFGTTNKFVQLFYSDLAGVPNFYNNRIYVNGVKRNQFFLESDRFNDGKRVVNTLFNQEPDLVTGDKVKVEFLGIDEKVYRYLFSIAQISGEGGPPVSPADPDTNFSNGALGYFSSSAITADSIVVR